MAEKPTIFVAYPYSFKKADYRAPFKKVAREYGVEFTYADQKITAIHILEKIIEMMEEAEFSLFDITTWNANVALELGVAMGRGLDYYILFNPENEEGDVPADLGGIDRLQWTSHAELHGELSRLMRQQFGAPPEERDEKAKARGAQVTGTPARSRARSRTLSNGNREWRSVGSLRAWACRSRSPSLLCVLSSRRASSAPRAKSAA